VAFRPQAAFPQGGLDLDEEFSLVDVGFLVVFDEGGFRGGRVGGEVQDEFGCLRSNGLVVVHAVYEAPPGRQTGRFAMSVGWVRGFVVVEVAARGVAEISDSGAGPVEA
jgi:hypothetical protein